jgi:hypothetical protein
VRASGFRCAPRRSWRVLLLAPLAWACTAANPAFEVVPPPRDAAEPPDQASPGRDVAPAADGPAGVALLVVGETVLAKGDSQLKASLTKLGFTVVVRDGQAVLAADAVGRAVVVISGSAWSDDVGAKFRDVPVPVVVFDCALFGPMKMTGTRSEIDYGTVDDRRLMIVDDTHSLAGGLSGLVTVASVDLEVSWGIPGSSAVKVATLVDQSTRFTIFAYPQGSPMVGMNAPARRVGSFVRFPDLASYTESGLMLFEAAVLWAVGQLY